MKNVLLVTFFSLTYPFCIAQNTTAGDSLLRKLKVMPDTQQDTNRVLLLNNIAYQNSYNKPDTSLQLAQEAYQLAQKINFPIGEAGALTLMAISYVQLGDYAKALNLFNKSKEIQIRIKNISGVIVTLTNISDCYMQQGDWHKALKIMLEGYQLFKNNPNGNLNIEHIFFSNLGEDYYNLGQLDSAAYYLKKALPLAIKYDDEVVQVIHYTLGDVAMARHQTVQARDYYQQVIESATKDNNFIHLYETYYRMTKLFQQTAQLDSTLHFAKLALSFGQKASYAKGILKASQLLTNLYKGKNDTEALRYFEIASAAKDSLYSQDRVKQLLLYNFEERQKQLEIEAANAAYRNSLKNYIFGGLLAILAGIAAFFYRNIRREKKAKILLQHQKEEIQSTLTTLKSTQNQLIQKEKLASLGELTAGIAHEIQNPLNFVNNFSELSVDLVKDLKDELKRPDKDETYIDELFDDLSQNQEKINHHGKRASSIVKGMLEHSRASTGVKELTDINKLVEESLRLSYHAMRAKDKSFNADFRMELDENLPKIEVIPQDMGRVLLNLINNAFYAVHQKNLRGFESLEGLKSDYTPSVVVSTFKKEGFIEIKVQDNGSGIPDAIKSKIFQPFFTTKPTGEGTGLGLSLSYDIVTKGHGGSLEVISAEGVGSEFVITL